MLLCAITLFVLAAYCEARGANIINGKDVDRPGKYPWQVSLQKSNGFHFCGGSIVASKWIVTAAHCITGNPSQQKVVVGLHDKSRRQGTPKDYGVRRYVPHQQYRFPANDIGLIELSSPIQFNSNVKAIALARHREFGPSSQCVISGWGNTRGGQNSSPNILQETSIPIADASKCKQFTRQDEVVCLYNGRSGSCQGDSGGPLACKSGSSWKLAGATSWGLKDCPVTTAYSVYSDVGYFNSWIMQNSRNLS